MVDDSRDTGIPTRAIHESYLDMQQAHRRYRRFKHESPGDTRQAHGDFQEAVLTFFELLRPHLKRKSAMHRFWEGELPSYPDRPLQTDAAKQYYLRNGVGVWSLQEHIQVAQTPAAGDSGQAIADGGNGFETYHERLGLTDRQRLVAIEPQDGGQLLYKELRATAGLQHLDTWDTTQERRRDSGNGFMAGETSVDVTLRHVADWKLATAKRLLAEAADKLSLLSRVDVDHEDGAIVNFDQSREDVEPEYRTAEYDSSPDI